MTSFGHTTSSMNRNGIQVAIGQRWQSMDKRRPARSCEVVSISGGVATLLEYERNRQSDGLVAALKSTDTQIAGRAAAWKPDRVQVHIDRLHEHSTGWCLLA